MKRPILCVICAAAFLGCAPGFDPDLSGLDGTDDGSTGGATSDGTGTATATSDGSTDDTGSTSDGSTGETGSTGDTGTDGSTDTGEPDPLKPGDLCHPFAEFLDGVPECPDNFNCYFQFWDMQEEYWHWTCELAEGMGEFGDECSLSGSNTCASGNYCTAKAVFTDGDCDFGYCCAEQCDVLEPSCTGTDYTCSPYSQDTSSYPMFFQDTDIPYIGQCAKP